MLNALQKVNGVVAQKAPRGFFKGNRARFVEALRGRLKLDSGYVLLKGPVEQPVYDDDTEFLLTAEANFAYLFGVDEPETWGLIDLESGRSTLLLHESSPERSYWMKVKSLSEFSEQFDGEAVAKIESLAELIGLTEENKGAYGKRLYVLEGPNRLTNGQLHVPSDKEVGELCGPTLSPSRDVYSALAEVRKAKSEEEVRLVEQAAKVTGQVADALAALVGEGKSELQVSHHFQALAMYLGNFYPSFPPVVQFSQNAHKAFHNSSNLAVGKKGDLAVLHLGLRVEGLAGKLVRTVPVSGEFTARQAELHGAVRAVFEELKARIGPYGEFVGLLEERLADLLVRVGAAKGPKERLVASGAVKQFYEPDVLSFIGFDVTDPLTVELRKGEKGGELTANSALFFKLAVVFDKAFGEHSELLETDWLKAVAKEVPAIKMGEVVIVRKAC